MSYIMTVPRIIYTFWHSRKHPPLVTACIKRMYEIHDGWTIRVLGPEDLPQSIAGLPPNVMSDWIRLHTLARTGGVWLDASCVCVAPVSAWVAIDDSAFCGFRSYAGCVDSYAFAAPANDPFVCAWRDAFDVSLADPIAYAKQYAEIARCATFRAFREPSLAKKLPYLNIVLCSCVVARAAGLRRLSDPYDARGPFDFNVDSLFLSDTCPPPLIKFDNVDRREVARRMRAVTKPSVLGKALGITPCAPRRSNRISARRVKKLSATAKA